ncbi:hypothetical protein TNCV_2249501 [Trichonephila clavipes]|nr:hypothetical protein TNCV_2249501 [Trichonephila clavipes]
MHQISFVDCNIEVAKTTRNRQAMQGQNFSRPAGSHHLRSVTRGRNIDKGIGYQTNKLAKCVHSFFKLEWYGGHCLQHMVSPSNDPWYHASPAVCTLHPTTTCVVTHAMASRSHFSTREFSTSLGKSVTRRSPTLLLPFFALPDPLMCL